MITTLLLQSKNRLNGTPDNFKIRLIRSFRNVRCVHFVSFMIANTTYSLNSTDDRFEIQFIEIANPSNIIASPVIIPTGIYNIFQLETYLDNVLSGLVAGTSVSFNTTTNRFEIVNTAYTIIIGNFGGKMQNVLGFNSNNITAPLGVLVSDKNPIGLESPRMYLINVNEFPSNSYILGSEQKEFNFFVINSQGVNQINTFDTRSRAQSVMLNKDLGNILSVSIYNEDMKPMLNMTDSEMILQIEHDD